MYLGKHYNLVHQKGKNNVMIKRKDLIVSTNTKTKKALQEVLYAWYREQTKKHLTDVLQNHNIGNVNKVFVRNQKTRWGSCSSKGNLSFNLRISMAPLDVIEYLVIHELTHLEEPNHSKDFWLKVQSKCPKYKKHEDFLRKNGSHMKI
jgi:hypothetical protein